MTSAALLEPAEGEDLYSFLAEQVERPVREALNAAGDGQRLRITSLPEMVLDDLCGRLHDTGAFTVLKMTTAPKHPWEAAEGRLIELRNSLQQPLLVLIPPGARSSAEDSLDIATFHELSLQSFGGDLWKTLLERLPEPLRKQVDEALSYLREEKRHRNDDELTQYLLTVLKNGSTAAAAGAALYYFGLIPDRGLFERHSQPFWLSRNVKCCEQLADIREPLRSRIGKVGLKPGPLQNDLFSFLRTRRSDDTRSWAGDIACDPAWARLSLDQWPFVEGAEEPTKLRLILEPLDLPLQPADEVAGAAQLPLLQLDGKRPMKVRFRSNPPPSELQHWASYRVQILTLDGDEQSVAWESNSYKRPRGRNRLITRSIKIADLESSLEEGTYFLRVHAYDQDGVLLTTPEHLDPDDENSRLENESEPFLAARGAEVGQDTEPRAINVPSLVDAWTAVASRGFGKTVQEEVPELATVRGAWREPVGATVRGDAHFRLEGTEFAGFSIVVPGLLRRIELTSLQNPKELGAYRLDLKHGLRQSDIEINRQKHEALLPTPENAAFLEAREAVFGVILGQAIARCDADEEPQMRLGIVETCDLGSMAQEIQSYAEAYLAVEKGLESSRSGPAASHRRALAMVDVLELRWPRAAGDPGRALVLGPTHPLRLLWHLQHASLCGKAVTDLREGVLKVPVWSEFMEQVRRGLLPLNLPLLLFDARGRAYVEQGPLTTHWSLYVPDRSNGDRQLDVATCRDAARRLLGIRTRGPASALVSPSDVARRLFEYLVQHPYVEQLRINVFNPGDGELLADVLREVEKLRVAARHRGNTPPLRYSVQMFGPAQHLDQMGEGLEALLDPDRQVGEDDEFTQAAANHLLPKLVFARNQTEDFLHDPGEYTAHVSVFLEQFSVQGHVGSVAGMRRGSFVGGLVQEAEAVLESQGNVFGWHKGVKPRAAANAEPGELLLVQTLQAMHSIQASAANGSQTKEDEAPKLALQLDARAQGLLRSVHRTSDWVLTVDRNLGLDYFDSRVSAREVGYLIDFAPEYLQEDRQRILLTTKSTAELQYLVQPALEKFGLLWVPGDEVPVLEALRSLSGRLALRLLSSPTRCAEVIGLLLARWTLEQAGLLADRIVIPLDAHQSWFKTKPDETPLGGWSQKRADLLIVGFDPEARRVLMDIVEVKMRSGDLHDAERLFLYQGMREQSDKTEEALRRAFDRDLYPAGRADASLRAKELSTLLTFYIRRAVRYGLCGDAEAEVAMDFVQTLDSGYSLDFNKLGVVFHQQGHGAHVDEEEPGYPVHRLGLEVANRLLKDARVRFSSVVSEAKERTHPSRPPPGRPAEARGDKDLESFKSQLQGRSKVRQLVKRPSTEPQASGSGVEEASGPEDAQESGQERTPHGGRVYPVEESRRLDAAEAQSVPLGGNAEAEDTDAIPPSATPEVADGNAAGGVPTDEVAAPPSPTPERDKEEAGAGEHQSEHHAPVQPSLAPPGALLGATELTVQYGLMGRSGSSTVGVDLTGCNTISLFGVQGFGKSYTLGVIAEMGAMQIPGVNRLPSQLATVVFHYHKSDAYAPEYATAVRPNQKPREVERLLAEYNAQPAGLPDVVLLSPEAKLEDRRREFPNLEVRPIKFSSGEIGADGWKFLLGAVGNDSLYVRQLVAIMRRHRAGLTLDKLRQDIQAAHLPDASARLAEDRLTLAEPYIDDSARLQDVLRPGRTVIVDLRDEWIEKDEALGLFVVMMNIFASAKREDGKDFNKLMVFDEAHKYITESDLIGQVVETIREMRHKATSVLIASQDPLSVPRAVVELTSLLVLHRMTSPQWLKHLKSAISSLSETTEAHLAQLQPGEALVWAQRSTDKRFSLRPQKVTVRPRVTQHGGGTKTAVDGETVR